MEINIIHCLAKGMWTPDHNTYSCLLNIQKPNGFSPSFATITPLGRLSSIFWIVDMGICAHQNTLMSGEAVSGAVSVPFQLSMI